MNKYAAWFILAATCLSGCRNVTHRAEEAHFDSSSQGATVTVQEPTTEGLTACTVDPAKSEFATASDPATEQASTQANLKEEQAKAAEPERAKGADTVVAEATKADNVATDTHCNAGRQAAEAVAEVETRSHSLVQTKADSGQAPVCCPVPTQDAARTGEKNVEDKASNIYQAGRTAIPDQAPQQSLSREVWYCIVSIWGAMFTYILSPLAVEFVRQRMGRGSKKPLPMSANGVEGHGNEEAQRQAVRRLGRCVVSDGQLDHGESDEEFYTLTLRELCHTVRQVKKGQEPSVCQK